MSSYSNNSGSGAFFLIILVIIAVLFIFEHFDRQSNQSHKTLTVEGKSSTKTSDLHTQYQFASTSGGIYVVKHKDYLRLHVGNRYKGTVKGTFAPTFESFIHVGIDTSFLKSRGLLPTNKGTSFKDLTLKDSSKIVIYNR